MTGPGSTVGTDALRGGFELYADPFTTNDTILTQ